jgi:hypothetical protein
MAAGVALLLAASRLAMAFSAGGSGSASEMGTVVADIDENPLQSLAFGPFPIT